MRTQVTLRISSELNRQLKKVLREEKISVNEIVLKSLSHFLTASRFQKLQKKAIHRARKKGIFTDEDVFKKLSS